MVAVQSINDESELKLSLFDTGTPCIAHGIV